MNTLLPSTMYFKRYFMTCFLIYLYFLGKLGPQFYFHLMPVTVKCLIILTPKIITTLCFVNDYIYIYGDNVVRRSIIP